ncbi:unnamed protein product [Calypogeia fissa]
MVVYPRGGAGAAAEVRDGGGGGHRRGRQGGGSRAGTGASHGGLAQKDRLADLIPRAHWPGTIQPLKNLPVWQTSTGILIGRTHPDPYGYSGLKTCSWLSAPQQNSSAAPSPPFGATSAVRTICGPLIGMKLTAQLKIFRDLI